MWEIISTPDGILAVGNYVNNYPLVKTTWSIEHMFNGNSFPVDGYLVYLPSAVDYIDILYADWLLNNSNPRVILVYTRESLKEYLSKII